jgi:hypothetical protein
MGRRLLEELQGIEEPIQNVAFYCGNQEDMRMSNSPAPSVHADEVRSQGGHHLAGYNSRSLKEAGILLIAQLMPPGNMSFGYDQRVALTEGIDIEDA